MDRQILDVIDVYERRLAHVRSTASMFLNVQHESSRQQAPQTTKMSDHVDAEREENVDEEIEAPVCNSTTLFG